MIRAEVARALACRVEIHLGLHVSHGAAEGGSVSRAEAPASALADGTSKPANGWLRALAARLPTVH